MLKASIDIGSNTVLLLIANDAGPGFKELESHSTVTALGKNLDKNGEFEQQSMESTLSALTRYHEIIHQYEIPPRAVTVTATEASRVASNAREFFQSIEQKLDFKIHIITSEAEAYYTAMGVCQHRQRQVENKEAVSLMDIGGASSELIKAHSHPFKYLSSVSLPLGSVRATGWLKTGEFDKKTTEIFDEFNNISNYQTSKLVCVAGTMTSLGAMMEGLSDFEEKKVNGLNFSFLDFGHFVQKLKRYSPQEILESYPFLGKRAESIVGGALVAYRLCEKLGVEDIEISTLGLRHGTLMNEGEVETRFKAEGS